VKCQSFKCQFERVNVVYSNGMAAELCETCSGKAKQRAGQLQKSIRIHPLKAVVEAEIGVGESVA